MRLDGRIEMADEHHTSGHEIDELLSVEAECVELMLADLARRYDETGRLNICGMILLGQRTVVHNDVSDLEEVRYESLGIGIGKERHLEQEGDVIAQLLAALFERARLLRAA